MLLVSSAESALRLLFVLFLFVAVLVMTRYATKWIAGYQKLQMAGRNLEIIETMRISSNKYLAIIRAGSDRYYAIGVGKDEITMLGELPADELVFVSQTQIQDSPRSAQQFGAVLDVFKKQMGERDK